MIAHVSSSEFIQKKKESFFTKSNEMSKMILMEVLFAKKNATYIPLNKDKSRYVCFIQRLLKTFEKNAP